MKRFKRLLIVLAAMVMATAAIFGCGKTPDKGGANPIAVYMPDGAPALAFAKLMHEENKLGKENLTYTVVKADNIGGFVANESATVALMPITGASKVANGKYKAVSVITHGNIFLIGKGDATTLSALKDKKVGVVQLANVPGLTFKHLLGEAGVDYAENEEVAGKVALYGITDPSTVAPSLKQGTYDYVVAPQPAVANVCKNVEGVSVRIDLNKLYSASGFPQAVLMVKNELCADANFINALTAALAESAGWIKEVNEDGSAKNAKTAVAAINAHFADGAQSTLKAPALSPDAIEGSNVYVQSVKDAEVKTLVKDYIDNMIKIQSTAAKAITDDFFIA